MSAERTVDSKADVAEAVTAMTLLNVATLITFISKIGLLKCDWSLYIVDARENRVKGLAF
jgi:hypothetical protein